MFRFFLLFILLLPVEASSLSSSDVSLLTDSQLWELITSDGSGLIVNNVAGTSVTQLYLDKNNTTVKDTSNGSLWTRKIVETATIPNTITPLMVSNKQTTPVSVKVARISEIEIPINQIIDNVIANPSTYPNLSNIISPYVSSSGPVSVNQGQVLPKVGLNTNTLIVGNYNRLNSFSQGTIDITHPSINYYYFYERPDFPGVYRYYIFSTDPGWCPYYGCTNGYSILTFDTVTITGNVKTIYGGKLYNVYGLSDYTTTDNGNITPQVTVDYTSIKTALQTALSPVNGANAQDMDKAIKNLPSKTGGDILHLYPTPSVGSAVSSSPARPPLTQADLDKWSVDNKIAVGNAIQNALDTIASNNPSDAGIQQQYYQDLKKDLGLGSGLGNSSNSSSTGSDTSYTGSVPTTEGVKVYTDRIGFVGQITTSWNSFTTNMKATPLFTFGSGLFSIPTSSSSIISINSGSIGGVQSFDLANWSAAFVAIKSLMLILFSFFSYKVIIMKK